MALYLAVLTPNRESMTKWWYYKSPTWWTNDLTGVHLQRMSGGLLTGVEIDLREAESKKTYPTQGAGLTNAGSTEHTAQLIAALHVGEHLSQATDQKSALSKHHIWSEAVFQYLCCYISLEMEGSSASGTFQRPLDASELPFRISSVLKGFPLGWDVSMQTVLVCSIFSKNVFLLFFFWDNIIVSSLPFLPSNPHR